MPCAITDSLGFMASTGAFVPLPSQQIFAVPSSPDYRVSYAGTYRPLIGQNPLITSPPLRYGVLATTDSNGQYSFTLPYGSGETNPAQPPAVWTLLFPNGSQLSGIVPSDPGPFSVDQLIAAHGWTWVGSIYLAPVTQGSFAKGTVIFSGSSPSATVLFLSPFVVNTYQITLSPSTDSNDATIPSVAWADKTTTGFTLHVSPATYVGSVDFEAKL